MKRVILAVLFGLLTQIALSGLTAKPVIASSQAGRVTMEFDLSAQAAGQEVKLWLPYPVSNSQQLIDQISWQGDFTEAAVYTDRANGNPILFARWSDQTTSRKMTLSFNAERTEQKNENLHESSADIDLATFAPYLVATSMGPVDGPVKDQADAITAGKKTILAKARAIYDWTVDNSFRDPKTRGCGLGDVPQLLGRPGGKCADISSLYVALARSAGVPAREVLGLRLAQKGGTDITGWQHCWAEFYLPETGWIPVDPADVRKAMLKQKLALNDPKVAELREYFFGNLDSYRIKLSEGRDLVLNPPQEGLALNYLMYPFAQVGGRTIDWLEPATFKYKIMFKD
ncbi:MAG: transglutaminase domain-containing protein [Geopsychrobacter sp.]|nr:transglutaminase domain-containing protein [Geopsychrobacter sp.]